MKYTSGYFSEGRHYTWYKCETEPTKAQLGKLRAVPWIERAEIDSGELYIKMNLNKQPKRIYDLSQPALTKYLTEIMDA